MSYFKEKRYIKNRMLNNLSINFRNSEIFAIEYLEKFKEMLPRYYMHSDMSIQFTLWYVGMVPVSESLDRHNG